MFIVILIREFNSRTWKLLLVIGPRDCWLRLEIIDTNTHMQAQDLEEFRTL